MKTIHFIDRKKWRAWLKLNAEISDELWLVFYRKSTGIMNINYNDAVEEALCFGWIDSTIKKIDNDRFIRKFTSRSAGSKWSELNIMRAEKMIEKGLMQKRGLEFFHNKRKYEGGIESKRKLNALPAPGFLIKALRGNRKAYINYSKLTAGYRKQIVLWLIDAKKDETRIKRLKEVLKLLEKNKKLGMK